ncbi:adenylate/guanylate cyclase domain-containing protein [Amorphus orientalis]|uniref:Adenylate cyclase n=1 Tax=Amorphus orientalis TaxID=649198 RepID=A0AAE3VPV2_9HYPH|nr:adenylate/guanylate cyclase domain-containing protein [Amorphus orientalis]MDQ0315843.1 adenylate cyclase [Amorphus orientalis]
MHTSGPAEARTDVPPDSHAIQQLSDWLVEQGLTRDNLDVLIQGFCEGVAALDIPLVRMHISIAALHPTVKGYGGYWWRGRGFVAEEYERSSMPQIGWQSSPLRVMLEDGVMAMRFRLDTNEPLEFPILDEFREEGGTDWVGRMVQFGDGESSTGLPGMLMSWLSDHPGGFSEADLATLDRLVPRLGLSCYRIALKRAAEDLLDAYVGTDAGHRVLSGQIERGAASRLNAVIMVADLRGFTHFADETEGEDVLASLNDTLGSLADIVDAHKGDVLKFLGDGFLAIFSLEGRDPPAVCAEALAAADAMQKANDELNAERTAVGRPPLVVDVALHLGEVMYGNVGSMRRLDFTVIGPAVNEASRIEALCEPLGERLLVSESFAGVCGVGLRTVGTHELRGVARTQELFAPVPG